VTYNIAFQPGKIGVPANVPLTLTWTTVPPGDYPFTCTVHPNMVGAIIAQP
jgi:plastocyanin